MSSAAVSLPYYMSTCYMLAVLFRTLTHTFCCVMHWGDALALQTTVSHRRVEAAVDSKAERELVTLSKLSQR